METGGDSLIRVNFFKLLILKKKKKTRKTELSLCHIEMIDCGESDSMVEICGRLDKSNT